MGDFTAKKGEMVKEKTRILARVSRDEQVKKDSPKTQIYNLKKSIDPKEEDLDEKHYVEDGRSAQIKDEEIRYKLNKISKRIDVSIPCDKRPEFFDMLVDAENKEFQRLKFTKWNRFSRHIIHGMVCRGFLKSHGIKLKAIKDSNEQFLIGVLFAFAQKELEDRSESTLDNQKVRFEKGFFKGKSKYGYKPIKDAESGLITSIEVDMEKAKDIVMIFITRLQGLKTLESCRKITVEKNIYEIEKDTGNKVKVGTERVRISESSYRLHLKDKRYCGIIEFDGKEKVGNYKPIIPTEFTFNDDGSLKSWKSDVFDTVQQIKRVKYMTAIELKAFNQKKKDMVSKLRQYAEEIGIDV